MAVPIANLSAVVTGAVQSAIDLAVDMVPTRDAVLETARASLAWFLRHLRAWLIAARAGAVEKLPVAAEAARRAAGSTVEASKPWVEMASKHILGLYGRLVTASLGNLPDGADAMTTGGKAYKYMLPVLLALLPFFFLCGGVWALTCRTMKGPGLSGARIPRGMFEANPKRYYATVRKARRSAAGTGWKLLGAAAVVAYGAYIAAKTLY